MDGMLELIEEIGFLFFVFDLLESDCARLEVVFIDSEDELGER
jgi:hypothetical protein